MRWLKAWVMAAGVGLLAACGGGNSPPNVLEQVSADGRFSILTEAVRQAGLADTLSNPGTLTVFAPTDAAFTALLGELGLSRQQLLADRELLTAVLTYHVLPARVERAGVPLGTAITTVQGGIFKVSSSAGALTITDGRNRATRITATDLPASNGVIHTIDRVLLPANRTLVQTAQALPEFSTLVEAVLAANLQGALSQPGPLTVFAPTNAAFAALLAELGLSKEQLLANTALLTRVLTYHVVPSRVLAANITPGQPVTSLQGERFTVGADLAITDARGRRANITATDVFASNGVIHVVDRVILPLPAENLVQVAQANPDFSILVQAVLAANLQGALSGPGPFTIFAPTNAAFASLLAELGVTAEQLLADTALLTQVLTYHVLPARVLAAGIVPGQQPATLQGARFTIDGSFTVTDARGRQARIVGTDVLASNGVIHVIDRVILPPAP